MRFPGDLLFKKSLQAILDLILGVWERWNVWKSQLKELLNVCKNIQPLFLPKTKTSRLMTVISPS